MAALRLLLCWPTLDREKWPTLAREVRAKLRNKNNFANKFHFFANFVAFSPSGISVSPSRVSYSPVSTFASLLQSS